MTQRENERGRPLVDRRRAVRGRTPLGLAACTLAGPTSAVGQLRGLTTAKLQLGNYSITASYSRGQNFLPSSTAGPTDVTVGFSQPCITTPHNTAPCPWPAANP